MSQQWLHPLDSESCATRPSHWSASLIPGRGPPIPAEIPDAFCPRLPKHKRQTPPGLSGAQYHGGGGSARKGAGLRRSPQQEVPRESGPSEAERWGRDCGQPAGPYPSRGTLYTQQLTEPRPGQSAGDGTEAGPRGEALKQASEVPEESLMGEAAGGAGGAGSAGAHHSRGRPSEFLVSSPLLARTGGAAPGLPSLRSTKDPGTEAGSRHSAPRSRRQSQAPAQGRNAGAEPGGSTWSRVGSLVPKPLLATAKPAPRPS